MSKQNCRHSCNSLWAYALLACAAALLLAIGGLSPVMLHAKPVKDSQSIEKLIGRIVSNDASAAQKAKAATELVNFGAEAVPPLLHVLSSPDVGNSRFYAIYVLGCLKSKDGVGALCRLLADRNYGPRRYAAIALGQIADPAAVEPLQKALSDVSFVRTDAIDALMRIDLPGARHVLEDYFFSGSYMRFNLGISCSPARVRMGDAVELRAVLSNLSDQAITLHLAGGRPSSEIVIRLDDGLFIRSLIISFQDLRERMETHVLNPGDKFVWSVQGQVKQVAVQADPCAPAPKPASSRGLVLGDRAYLLPKLGKLQIRAIVELQSLAKDGRKGVKVVSEEASLAVY